MMTLSSAVNVSKEALHTGFQVFEIGTQPIGNHQALLIRWHGFFRLAVVETVQYMKGLHHFYQIDAVQLHVIPK